MTHNHVLRHCLWTKCSQNQPETQQLFGLETCSVRRSWWWGKTFLLF